MLEDAADPIVKPFYRGNLPHYNPNDSQYFLTYRLHGSIPKSERARLFALYQRAKTDSEKRAFFKAYDRVLDRNGPYHLQNPLIRTIVMNSLAHIGERDFYIYAYCVMPNHVHAVVELRDASKPLYRIMQSHKRHTAREGNIILGTAGSRFWAKETYDHVVRTGRLHGAIWYTILNPVAAGFVARWRDWPGTYLSPDCFGYE